MKTLPIHAGPIECITFGPHGDVVATASDKGTLIRVVNVSTAQRVHFFRRGTMPATITDIAFSANGKFISTASTSETLHVFKLDSGSSGPISSAGGWSSYLPMSILPSVVSDLMEPVRNFAHAKVLEPGSECISAVHPYLNNHSISLIIIKLCLFFPRPDRRVLSRWRRPRASSLSTRLIQKRAVSAPSSKSSRCSKHRARAAQQQGPRPRFRPAARQQSCNPFNLLV